MVDIFPKNKEIINISNYEDNCLLMSIYAIIGGKRCKSYISKAISQMLLP